MATLSMSSKQSCIAVLLVAIVVLNYACVESLAQESQFARSLLTELTEDVVAAGGFHVELLNREHHASPLKSEQPLSLTQRYADAARRSRARAASLKNVGPRGSRALISNATAGGSASSPIYYQEQEYIMLVTLGTPARTFTAIADTGSDLVWVQCKPCSISCFKQPDALFDPTKSSTYAKINCDNKLCKELQPTSCSSGCQYDYGYGDGSFTDGVFSSETLTITSVSGTTSSVPNFAFGCGSDDEGDFSGSDGLVGLGRGNFSMPSQLAPILGHKFGYCLATFTDAINKSSTLVIGNAAQPSNISGMHFTPLVPNPVNPSFYYVGIESMSVDGKKLNISASAFDVDSDGNGGTIVDSGTSLYFLTPQAYDPLVNALKSQIKYPVTTAGQQLGYDLCYNVSGVSAPGFPVISLLFKGSGAEYVFPQLNSFAPIDENGTTCLMVISNVGFSILGNMQQQNFFLLFDEEKKQFGFKPQQCDQGK